MVEFSTNRFSACLLESCATRFHRCAHSFFSSTNQWRKQRNS